MKKNNLETHTTQNYYFFMYFWGYYNAGALSYKKIIDFIVNGFNPKFSYF